MMGTIMKITIILLMLPGISEAFRGKVKNITGIYSAEEIREKQNQITSEGVLKKSMSTGEIDCGRECAHSNNCVSFFYNANAQSCQIHSSRLYNFPAASPTRSTGEQFYRMTGREPLFVDCYDILLDSEGGSGVYTINPAGNPVSVYCDQDTDGGGWLVFQRRQDGSEDFFRGWDDYEQGFGDIQSEFWIGNALLANLTSQRNYILRVDLEDFENETAFAKYDSFAVGPASTNYTLFAEGYSGTAGDGLQRHNGYEFSTKDRDNDIYHIHCADKFKGAWWYTNCHSSHLNGLYLRGNHTSFHDGVNWKFWRGAQYSLKTTEMKFRPRRN